MSRSCLEIRIEPLASNTSPTLSSIVPPTSSTSPLKSMTAAALLPAVSDSAREPLQSSVERLALPLASVPRPMLAANITLVPDSVTPSDCVPRMATDSACPRTDSQLRESFAADACASTRPKSRFFISTPIALASVEVASRAEISAPVITMRRASATVAPSLSVTVFLYCSKPSVPESDRKSPTEALTVP